MGYIGWSYPASESYASEFPTAQLEALSNDGYLPEITWEPWDDSSGVNQPNYSLASIIAGNHDSYIKSWAEAAKAYGKPLLIRFAQEMNGTWYPWSEQVNGNSPGEYVQAWQHVHNIFAEDAVQNVKWVWSPNVVGSGASSDLAELYPGDAYVDYIGIDGYSYPNDGCPAASELFGPTLAITNQLSVRPAMIAETGIDSACSSQTSLMASLLNWTSANPRIFALTWFDRNTASADYSLTSSLEWRMHSFVSPVTVNAHRKQPHPAHRKQPHVVSR
jgi:beta-mannanase